MTLKTLTPAMTDEHKIALAIATPIVVVVLAQIYFAVSFALFKRNRYAGHRQRTAALNARKTERIKSTHRKRPY